MAFLMHRRLQYACAEGPCRESACIIRSGEGTSNVRLHMHAFLATVLSDVHSHGGGGWLTWTDG
jgi:hypothetical protein